MTPIAEALALDAADQISAELQRCTDALDRTPCCDVMERQWDDRPWITPPSTEERLRQALAEARRQERRAEFNARQYRELVAKRSDYKRDSELLEWLLDQMVYVRDPVGQGWTLHEVYPGDDAYDAVHQAYKDATEGRT